MTDPTVSAEQVARASAVAALDRVMADIGESINDALTVVDPRLLDQEVHERVGRLIDSHAAVRSAITKSEWLVRAGG